MDKRRKSSLAHPLGCTIEAEFWAKVPLPLLEARLMVVAATPPTLDSGSRFLLEMSDYQSHCALRMKG